MKRAAVINLGKNILDSSAPKGYDGPRRIWSLWDIMDQFNAGELFLAIKNLEGIASALEAGSNASGAFFTAISVLVGTTDQTPQLKAETAMLSMIVQALQHVLGVCQSANFTDAQSIVLSAMHRIKTSSQDFSTLRVECCHVLDSIGRECSKRVFLLVNQRYVGFVDNPNLMGESVSSAFPSAVPDIISAGNCLAADCNTAAVFHLMRVVEWGMRALCVKLGITKLRQKYKKTGIISYTPIAYSEWERILNTLQSKVDERAAKIKRGPKRQEFQEFYNPLISEIMRFKDAWRNHVMHTRAEYGPEDANAVLAHVKRFMAILSTKVSEV